MRLPAVSAKVVRLLPAVFVGSRRAGSGQITTAGRRLPLPWGRKAGRLPARRHVRDLRPPARREYKEGTDGDDGRPDTSITAAERQKIEQQKEREAQLARQEEAQIDAFVLVFLEKSAAPRCCGESPPPKNEGLQGQDAGGRMCGVLVVHNYPRGSRAHHPSTSLPPPDSTAAISASVMGVRPKRGARSASSTARPDGTAATAGAAAAGAGAGAESSFLSSDRLPRNLMSGTWPRFGAGSSAGGAAGAAGAGAAGARPRAPRRAPRRRPCRASSSRRRPGPRRRPRRTNSGRRPPCPSARPRTPCPCR